MGFALRAVNVSKSAVRARLTHPLSCDTLSRSQRENQVERKQQLSCECHFVVGSYKGEAFQEFISSACNPGFEITAVETSSSPGMNSDKPAALAATTADTLSGTGIS